MKSSADWIVPAVPVALAVTTGCAHTEHMHTVLPSGKGCQECLAEGAAWMHLRICMECGHVGCCDSSPGRHATGHFHSTRHPVMRSIEPGEAWGWCYVDQDYV